MPGGASDLSRAPSACLFAISPLLRLPQSASRRGVGGCPAFPASPSRRAWRVSGFPVGESAGVWLPGVWASPQSASRRVSGASQSASRRVSGFPLRSKNSTRSSCKSCEATTGITGSLATSTASRNSGRERRIWRRKLSRRRRDGDVTWAQFLRLEKYYSLPRARVVHGLQSRVAKS